jgi:hypothetical protein
LRITVVDTWFLIFDIHVVPFVVVVIPSKVDGIRNQALAKPRRSSLTFTLYIQIISIGIPIPKWTLFVRRNRNQR